MKTVVVIPAYEPDDRLPGYVRSLYEAGFTQTVVVDDGSGPNYRPIFEAVREVSGCTLLTHYENKGKGAALKTAFAHLLAKAKKEGRPAPAVVTADSDGQHTVEDVAKVCAAVEQHPGTLVLGCRDFGEGTPGRSALGNRVTSGAMRVFYGIDLKDTQTGLRGIPGPLLDAMARLPGQRYEYELNMLIWARQNVVEYTVVPIQTIYFDNNAGSHYRTVADSARILVRVLSGVCQYGAAAGLSAVTDVFVYCLLVKLAFTGLPLGLRVLVSAIIARAVSSLLNYACNRRLPTAQNKAVAGTLWKYYCLWTVQLAASIGLTFGLCAWTGMDEMPAKLLVDLLLAALSYEVQLRWVFAAPAKKEGAPSAPDLPAWNGFGRAAKKAVRFALGRWHSDVQPLGGPCVYVVHHQNMFGPIHATACLDEEVHVWALSVFTHRESCFKQYYEYTFTQRFGWPKPLAYLAAGFLSLTIPALMKGVGAVPVLRGGLGIRDTMRQSVDLLAAGESLVICPDVAYSDDGAAIGETYLGFLMLEKYCYAKTGRHVAFVPLHCSAARKEVVAGRPVYCTDEQGAPATGKEARRLAAADLRGQMNALAAACGDLGIGSGETAEAAG